MDYEEEELEAMLNNYRQYIRQLQKAATFNLNTEKNTVGMSSDGLSKPSEMNAIRLTDDEVLKKN